MTAVETLRTTSQEEKAEFAQKVERTAEKALSTLAAANQEYVDAESRQLQSLMSQVKEELAAHATEVCISELYAILTNWYKLIYTCRNACTSSSASVVMVETITKLYNIHIRPDALWYV